MQIIIVHPFRTVALKADYSCILVNTGIPEEVLQGVLDGARQWFALPVRSYPVVLLQHAVCSRLLKG